MVECARVTLPRPLSTVREAEIEMRREIHDKIYQEYRKEFCNDKGEQESNLSQEESRGMKSIMKRMKKENLIIMRTDKSGKLCATTEEKYKEMGQEHVKGDIVVDRAKVRETDKIMNEHSAAWCGMWRTGSAHQHEDRVIQSKTSKSENRAKLYLSFKDHKKGQEKTRPIGTANTSNTRAFANSVSDLLEAVADSEVRKFEVISTEDLMHGVKKNNAKIAEEKKRKEEEALKRRWVCFKEKNWLKRCKRCEEQVRPTLNTIELDLNAVDGEELVGRQVLKSPEKLQSSLRELQRPVDPKAEEEMKEKNSENHKKIITEVLEEILRKIPEIIEVSEVEDAGTMPHDSLIELTEGEVEAAASLLEPKNENEPNNNKLKEINKSKEVPEEEDVGTLPHPSLKEPTKIMSNQIVEEVLEEVMLIIAEKESRRSCRDCVEEFEKAVLSRCKHCEEGAEEKTWAMVGMDAVALFPSLSGRRTASIVRKRAAASNIKIQGFNWKKAAIYIKINKHLTRNIPKNVRKFMPIRKSNKGTTPGMSSQGLKSKEGQENLQWIFIARNPSQEEEKELVSLVLEIAVRVLWENYCYDFGGQTFLQKEGGPIGQRPTMAASRIVMQDFFENYERVLLSANLEINLLKVYVDDGRQITTILDKGMRYSKEEDMFKWSKEDEEEDIEREKEGESKSSFMARLCLPLMNAINPDLTFTAEVAEDFEDKKLPTLDTKLWMEEDGQVFHSYYEKEMRSQVLLEKDSAMSIRQKMCILSNEMTRRLYNLDSSMENLEEEVTEVVENFTRQSKNSGWDRKETREMIISGYRGWQRRLKRRVEECGLEYRNAASSLPTRARKKLTGKEDWYRKKNCMEKIEEQKNLYKKRLKKKQLVKPKKDRQSNNIAVMFVPYTIGGELAKRLREAEAQLEGQTGYRIKIVERTGTKVEDLLHRSNPWQGQDCGRKECLLCKTKVKLDRFKEQDCTKRCIVYETWCLTCEMREISRIEDEEEDEKVRREKIRNFKRYKYIGETSRSIYERGLEHDRDWKELKKDSHMVKHFFDVHEEEEAEEMEFGMRIVNACRSAFNRQISESVEIQNNKDKHHILNSRSEYNRCALPRLTAKLGDETYDKVDKIKKEERQAEVELEKKIRNLKIKNNKKRREMAGRSDQPASKKRKTGEDTYKRVIVEDKDAEKRKNLDTFPIFNKMRKIEKEEKDSETEQPENEIEKDTDSNDDEKSWEERIREKEERMEQEEKNRNERIEKARRLNQSYQLLRLCRETLKENGESWEISKERRSEEREKERQKKERMMKAQNQKIQTLNRIEKNQIQKKITENLQVLPRNRQKIVEMELEKERRLDLVEAKHQIWKKWRNSKGKKKFNIRIGEDKEKGDLERQLEKIEKEVEKYKAELEKIRDEKERREFQRDKKKKKEAHWEMMKWVVQFINNNKPKWEEIKKQRKEGEKKEEEKLKWEELSKEEKIELIKLEKEEKKHNIKVNKEKRLEEAKRLKENWKRRETEEDYDIDEETEEPEDLMKEDTAQKSPQETAQMKEEEEKNTDKDEKQKQAVIPEASLVNEKEGEEGKEEETEEEGEINQVGLFDYLGIEEEVNSLCFVCIMSPCICILANIEKQMKRILEKEDEKKVEQPEIGRKKRKRETEEEEEGTPQKQYKESVQMRTLPLYLVGGGTQRSQKSV